MVCHLAAAQCPLSRICEVRSLFLFIVDDDVSLESIFLSLFILMSQNRTGLQADQRNHLDLRLVRGIRGSLTRRMLRGGPLASARKADVGGAPAFFRSQVA